MKAQEAKDIVRNIRTERARIAYFKEEDERLEKEKLVQDYSKSENFKKDLDSIYGSIRHFAGADYEGITINRNQLLQMDHIAWLALERELTKNGFKVKGWLPDYIRPGEEAHDISVEQIMWVGSASGYLTVNWK